MAADGTIKINTELDSSKAQSAMSKFSSLAQGALKGVTVAIGAASTAMAAMSGYAIKVGSEFEAGMSKVEAISGATKEELKKLEEQAISLGASTAFSASEAAAGMENLASAGFTVNEITEAMPGMLNLAASSGEDLAVAADIAASTLRGFGLEADQAAHVADVLAKNAADTNAAVYDTGEAMKYVAPVASAMGLSFEEVTASIGIMANAGIQGSQAGTTLRGALTRLVNPTDKMKETMDELGLSFFDAEGKMISITDMTAIMQKKMEGLTDKQKNAALATLFGQEALSGMLALIDAGPQELSELTQSLVDCDGAAEEMAGTMQNNLKGSLEGFMGAAETFGIQIYEKIKEPLRGVVEDGTEYINRLADSFESGGLNGTVKEAGEIFGELVEKIEDTSDVAKDVITPFKNIATVGKNIGKAVLPTAAKAFTLLSENIDVVAAVTVTAYTALKTYGKISTTVTAIKKASAAATKVLTRMEKANAIQLVAMNGGLTLQQTLFGLLTGKITLATAATGLMAKAQTALNAAMNANPIGLTVTALVALTAGMAAYLLITDDTKEAVWELNKEQKEMIDSCDEVTQAMKESHESREKNIQSIDLEYDKYEKLLAELRSVTDENGKVKEGYEDRAKIITGQLSEALGVEIEMQDGVIQKYQETVEAIKEVIVQKKAEAILSSMQADMAEAYTKTAEAMKTYRDASSVAADAEAEAAEAAQKVADLKAKILEAQKAGTDDNQVIAEWANELIAAQESLDNATAALDEANGKMAESKAEIEGLSEELNNYNLLMDAVASGDVANIENALNSLITSYKSYNAQALTSSEETRKEMYEQANGYVESMRLIQDGTIQVADEIYEATADSAVKTIENFNQLPGGIAQGIEDIGPKASSAMIAALIQADLDGKLDAEGQKSLEALLQAYSTLPEDLKSQIMVGVDGALDGFDTSSPKLNAKGEEVLSTLVKTLNDYGIEDETYMIGSNAANGMSTGISSQKHNVEAAGTEIADAAESGAATADGYTPGSNFGEGFVSGIGGWIQSAASKAIQLASAASNAAKKTLDEHSPSRLTRKFGKWFSQGLGLGISDEEDYAVDTAEELAKNTIDALDTDALYEKMKSIDASEMMSRVNAAVEDVQSKAAQVVIGGVSAKLQESGSLGRAQTNNPGIDYKKLREEVAMGVADEISKLRFQIGTREFGRVVRSYNE